MKTFSAKPASIQHRWYLVDAQDLILGRLAVTLSTILRGKDKPFYTPHVDCGDYVVVINAEKVALTGNKWNDKTYYWHTGYPGGIKQRTAKEVRQSAFPDRLIHKAVERMIPRGPLGRQILKKLKIYAGNEHPHTAQKPEVLDIASRNPKNKKGL